MCKENGWCEEVNGNENKGLRPAIDNLLEDWMTLHSLSQEDIQAKKLTSSVIEYPVLTAFIIILLI
jgi:hypothetical protein